MNFGIAILGSPKDNDAIQGMQFQLPYQLRNNVPMVGLHGIVSRPLPGAQGVVLFRGGNPSNAVCIGTNDPRHYRAGLPNGVVGLAHHLGASFLIYSDRTEVDGGGKLVVVKNASKVRVEGDLECTGQITAHCDSGPVHLTTHTHGDPQSGNTAPPTPGT
jgi:phage gp45-like